MTVINVLSLGEEGLAVADEQASMGVRTENSFQKLFNLNNTSIYGASGHADFTKEVYDMVHERVASNPDSQSLNDLRGLVNSAMISVKDHSKDLRLRGTLSISLRNYLSGMLDGGEPIADYIKGESSQILDNFERNFNSSFVMAGINGGGNFGIYQMSSSGFSLVSSSPYSSIGSGADQSQNVLSEYITNIKRDERKVIDREEGLSKIIEATNASARINQGVGGTISIVYITKKGVVTSSEDESRLASEIVDSVRLGFVKRKKSLELLGDLVYHKKGFKPVYSELMKSASNPENLNLALRGYKR